MSSQPRTLGSPVFKRRLAKSTIAVALAALAGVTLSSNSSAQNAINAVHVPALVSLGDAVVTGFSGATQAPSIESKFIDLNGPSMQVLSLSSSPLVLVSDTTDGRIKLQLKAGQVGQVFGIALDDQTIDGTKAPNIYITATSAFGIQIVTPDANGDGVPERATAGGPGASFMDGQFGGMEGAGPGTIFKVDGITGEVTLFANIELDGQPNSGPGLGNITFDPKTKQLFVSDLDTGMIHRLSLDGSLVDHFDHGAGGRMAAGTTPVLHSPSSRMNIQSSTFNSEDPATWGLAKPERRVWGLAINAGRLYYAVNNSTREIWSVGLAPNGSFTSDVRLEIVVPRGDHNPLITDIAFDKKGRIYLAQRGSMESRFDYSVFAKASVSNTLRYSRDPSTGGWVQTPGSYAIGKAAGHLEASGGIAIGSRQGRSCDYLWSTGDTLEPQQVVHGIQGNAISLVRPANTPPVQATFTVYDNRADKDGTQGHVGDVEVLRDCQSLPPVGIVPIHWKSGSSAHSKSWSHQKYGSSVHSKTRSHWKYASHVHTKRRSHWKHASNEHSKRRSHWKFASHIHTKRRSHWKHASNEHSKRRSHWKFASHIHTKRRSHWKHASNEHSKRRSHWKIASHVHTKRRSHWKHASNEHSKRRSHFKTASRVHTKRRSHFKTASRVHTKQRSHFKTASRVHTKRRSHFKTASRVHTKRRSHFKTASRVNIKRPPRIRQIKHRIRTAPTRIHRLRVQRPTTRLR